MAKQLLIAMSPQDFARLLGTKFVCEQNANIPGARKWHSCRLDDVLCLDDANAASGNCRITRKEVFEVYLNNIRGKRLTILHPRHGTSFVSVPKTLRVIEVTRSSQREKSSKNRK
ncbi:MAG: hypothetical protein Q7S36_01460 [Candidatus Liptonbacteria bacterium]|nr:hypothetical protein [Candidatus Liptonbacteria bacterium]